MKQLLPHHPKVRSIVVAILFWISFMGVFSASSTLFGQLAANPRWHTMLYGIIGTGSAFLVTWLFLKGTKASFTDFGLVWQRKTPIRFVQGVLQGAAIFIVIVLVLMVFGSGQLVRNSKEIGWWDIVIYLAIIPLALMEEVAFRAYPFVVLNRAVGLRITQVVVGVAFALYHVVGGWSLSIAFLGPFVWSFVFGLAAARSGGIAVPTGIHAVLNAAQVLIGLKGGAEPVWKISFPPEAANRAIVATDKLGMVLQIAVLLAAVIATEYFIRRFPRRGRGYAGCAD
jgi:membrane protease YdiL (CAAX protease family)